MKLQKTKAMALALLVVGTTGASTVYGQDAPKVNGPTAIHEQSARHFKDVSNTLSRLGIPETPFDYIIPAVTGGVVVLEGFTINGALRLDAAAQVKKLKWCTNVLDEVTLLDTGAELGRARQSILGILQKQVPQAFGQNNADIRIKVTLKGDVTLYGVIGPENKKRLEAAAEQIKFVDFVASVTNHVVEATN